MIKSELITKLSAQNPHLYKQDAEAIVDAILGTITAALARGDRVELRDFGVFAVKNRGLRLGRNPLNGKVVTVSEKARQHSSRAERCTVAPIRVMRERGSRPSGRCNRKSLQDERNESVDQDEQGF